MTDKNKTIFYSVVVCCIAVVILGCIVAFTYLKTEENRLEFRRKQFVDTQTETIIYDKYNHCLSLVMDKSKQNGSPCTVQDAEKVCSKVEKASKVESVQ